MNEAVGRRWIDRLHDLANLVDVNLVRELRPENDSCFRIVAPDRARRFDAGKLRHLNVEDANFGFVLERKGHGFFPIRSFEHWRVRREVALKYLAQISALGDVVFQFSSPAAPVASERGARSFLVVAQSKSIGGRGARGHRADEGPNHFPARRADRLSGRTAKSDSIH